MVHVLWLHLLSACGIPSTVPEPVPESRAAGGQLIPPPAAERPSEVRTLPPGALGVLVRAGHHHHVVFPAAEMVGRGLTREEQLAAYGGTPPEWFVSSSAELVLFDSEGDLARLPPLALKMQFWCENDGGIQFRPQVELPEVPTTPRPLVVVPGTSLEDPCCDAPDPRNGVVAFVRVGQPRPETAPMLRARPLDLPPEELEESCVYLITPRTPEGGAALACCMP